MVHLPEVSEWRPVCVCVCVCGLCESVCVVCVCVARWLVCVSVCTACAYGRRVHVCVCVCVCACVLVRGCCKLHLCCCQAQSEAIATSSIPADLNKLQLEQLENPQMFHSFIMVSCS